MSSNLDMYSFLTGTSYKLGAVMNRISLQSTNSMSDAGMIYHNPELQIKRGMVYDKLSALQRACEDLVNINVMGLDAWLELALQDVPH